MSEHTIYSDTTLAQALGEVREAYRKHKRVKVKIVAGLRSLSQNDISHAWYEQMALEDRQHDKQGHRRYCKLHHGVPILRDADEDYRQAYDTVIRPLSYETKLLAMDHWPVTSVMTKAQLSAYLEKVQADYRTRGVFLEFPQERAE